MKAKTTLWTTSLLMASAWGCAGAGEACGVDGDPCADVAPSCEGEDLDTSATSPCSPLFEPTFDKLHERVFTKKCALAGGACHTPEGTQGGLALSGDADADYDMLTGDPKWLGPNLGPCGAIYDRTHRAVGDSALMPPGTPLLDGELCALKTWLTNGAER